MPKNELAIKPGIFHWDHRSFDDFWVNRKRLAVLLKSPESVTPFGWFGGEGDLERVAVFEDQFAKMLLGRSPSDLCEGRVPLFICGICADYGCGAITCRVSLEPDLVVWDDFGWDVIDEDEGTSRHDNFLGHEFVFNRLSYERVFERYLKK